MSDIKDWSTTAASNNSSPPDGFPEGMAPSAVNNSARELMAAIRTQHEDPAWTDLGHTPAYASATTFTIATDVTANYAVGRRIRCTDATVLYGQITAVVYSAPNTIVTVLLDSGSLSASLSAVAPSVLDENSKPLTQAMVDLVHPVGSLYYSSVSTDPGTLFGGTWTAVEDVMILAHGSTYTAGDTGGSADAVVVTHTHSIDHDHGSFTTASGGTHSHTIRSGVNGNGSGGHDDANNGSNTTVDGNGAHTHSIDVPAYSGTSGSAGSSGAGANMPPYKVYYCWERTA